MTFSRTLIYKTVRCQKRYFKKHKTKNKTRTTKQQKGGMYRYYVGSFIKSVPKTEITPKNKKTKGKNSTAIPIRNAFPPGKIPKNSIHYKK